MPLSGRSDRADVSPLLELREARTLRPASSVAVGVLGAVIGLALVVPALLAADRNWALASTTTLGLILLWLFIVRPCVVIHAEGVRIVNPLRILDITWPMIDEVRSRWTLELVAQGRRYPAWGAPAETRRRRGRRGPAGRGAGVGPVGRSESEPERRSKAEARAVAAEIEARVAADRPRQEGRTPRIAVHSWDRVSVALLLGGIVFCVVGFLLG
jgi:hypothetical protein